jgi:hypothetical protein
MSNRVNSQDKPSIETSLRVAAYKDVLFHAKLHRWVKSHSNTRK